MRVSSPSPTGLTSASSVAITGGTITGITDLAVADGGTGASTALAARQNFGLGVPSGSTKIGTWVEDGGGLTGVSASGGSAFSHQVVYWTPPSAPYYIGMEWRPNLGTVNCTGGLWFRRSANNKIVTMSMAGDGGWHVFRWTNTTTFSADASSVGATNYVGSHPALVVYFDGTTLTFYQAAGASAKGGLQKLTEAVATFLGGVPDQVGVYYDAYDAASAANVLRVVFQAP